MSIQEDRSEVEAVINMEEPVESQEEVASSGAKPVLGGETRSEASAEWEAPASTNVARKVHSFHMIKVPKPFDLVDLGRQITAKFEELKATDMNSVTEEKDAVLTRLKEPRSVLKSLRQELRAKINQSKSFKEEMSSLKDDHELCKSVEELDTKVLRLEYELTHNSFPIQEERAIVKRINTLKASRPKVISNSDARQKRETIKETSILPLDEQIKELKAQITKLEKETREDEEKATSLISQSKRLYDIKTAIRAEIDELKAEQQAFKSEEYDKNVLFRNEVHTLAQTWDVESVQRLCLKQVDDFMHKWNTDRAFRSDYVKSNLNNIMYRFGSPDGRRLHDSAPEKSTSTEEDKKVRQEEESRKAKKEPEEEPAKVEKDGKENVKRGGKPAKKLKADFPKKSFDGNSSDAEVDEEQTREEVEGHIGVDDEAQLELERQKRREEEIEKAKAAEARKKRKEEKKKAQQEARLETERRKKQAEKEKKQRKKAAQVSALEKAESASTSNDSESGEPAAPATENGTAHVEAAPVESAVQQRGKKGVVQKVRTSVKPLRRKKRSTQQQLYDALQNHWQIVLAVVVLLLVGSAIMAYVM